ncbi:hypothetical protein Tco_0007093 [Tanacetum coccineum]
METKDTLSSCSNSEEQQMQQIQDKAKKSCMVSFRQLHSHLKLLSNNVLKGTRTESGFKRAFATLFGQDIETFTGTICKGSYFLDFDGIGDEIYSTVDACNTTKEMWTAIERLQQGESLNVQDVKTNLFWEFGKFTSQDEESMESYYSQFYKLMNELTRNNLQREEIDAVSYHKLFDILKQFQNEVYDIRSERLARSANPLALLAAA